MFLGKKLKKNLIILKSLHKYQYFIKKFSCNQIFSTGLCMGELGENKIQVIDQSDGYLSLFTDAKESINFYNYDNYLPPKS
jgi:hypothetical protein